MTRKITRGLAHIAQGLESCLYMGNICARRDWGHAKDYVRAQWLMLQADAPGDFVIASGQQHQVRDFITWAAADLGITLQFDGMGLEEIGTVVSVTGDKAPAVKPGDVILRIDARYFRPAEVDTLLGDASKARKLLDWQPQISARQMCAEMMAHDLAAAQRLALLRAHGHDVAVPGEGR